MRNRTKNSTNAGRYSNWTGSEVGPVMENGEFYTNPSDAPTASSGSDWTAEDTTKTIGTVSSLIQNVVNAIWGRSDQYRADALNQMYTQEKRSNTILWVVIGLVLALGVFLVVRKTK